MIWPLFRVEYTRQMGSIEAAFIGLARYIIAHFPNFTWMPLWYGGIPFPDAYPPLLHFTVAGFSTAAGVSPALAYHFVTALIYALTPVVLFWAARRLGADRGPAFLAAIGYSLLSPTCLFGGSVRRDLGGYLSPLRAITLISWGEGPHQASLLLLPVAIVTLHLALQRRQAYWYVVSALTMAAVVLSNWIGALALALAIAAYLASGVATGLGSGPAGSGPISICLRTAGIGTLAYGFAATWAMPSIVATIRANAPLLVGFKAPPLWLYLLAVAGFLILAVAVARLNWSPALRFGLLFLYGPALLTLCFYWFKFSFLPQSERYQLELDMAFWLLVAMLFSDPRLRQAMRGPLPKIAAAVFLIAAVSVAIRQHRVARDLGRPIAIEQTAEYRISMWLGANRPGQRVFARGSTGFWMTAFSDTPLITGGFDNGIRNQTLWGAIYLITVGDQLPVTLQWLQAMGVDAIIGGDRESTEVYHPFTHPEKLHALREIWRDGPEVIYEVPRRSRSLAQVIRKGDEVSDAPLFYISTELGKYLAALDDPSLPTATLGWQRGDSSTGTARIESTLQPDQLLSIQIAYDQGWRASANGNAIAVRSDKIGQIILEPGCNGSCSVDLVYDGGMELMLARAATAAAILGSIVWILWAVWKSPRTGAAQSA
jgi:hypothetical protein